MTALETLQIAMIGYEAEWTWKRVAVNGAYRNSMFVVYGLARNIVKGVPDHIELFKDFSTKSLKGQYYVITDM